MTNKNKAASVKQPILPRGWTEKKINDVLEYYEDQAEEEQVAEDEAAYQAAGHTMMAVPTALVPTVRKLIASRRRA